MINSLDEYMSMYVYKDDVNNDVNAINRELEMLEIPIRINHRDEKNLNEETRLSIIAKEIEQMMAIYKTEKEHHFTK